MMVRIGETVANRYLVKRELGAGGMGAVYEAMDLRTGGPVAVKTLHPHLARDQQFVSRLRREAQIAASIRTPRAVKVLDFDQHEGQPFLVMEYIEGEELATRLERDGLMTPEAALFISIEVARALEGAQAVGVVHRDLKPQNVRITGDGEIKVLDFGIARAENQPGITTTNVFTGTPEYCAPERLDGPGDIRADIYAIGIMLFEMLSGHRPFSGPTAFSVLRQQEVAPVPPLGIAVPLAVQYVIDRCLAKNPNDRFQTPTDLLAALRAAQDAVRGAPADTALPAPYPPPPSGVAATFIPSALPNGAVRPPLATTVERSSGAAPATIPAPTKGRPLLWIGGAVAALAVAGGGAVALLSRDGTPSPTPTAAATSSIGAGDRSPTTAPTAADTVVARTATPPTAAPTLPGALLLTPGQKLVINRSSNFSLDIDPLSCKGGSNRVTSRLTITSIEQDTRTPGRVTVAYVREMPEQPGVSCVVPYLPDGMTEQINLVVEATVDGQRREYRAIPAGGEGFTNEGSDNLYGKRAQGTWFFNNVQLRGERIRLDQRLASTEQVIHRIEIIP